MDYSQLVKSVYIDNPKLKLEVNGYEAPMIVGTETEVGYYKNGYIAKEIKKGWLQVIVYTSRFKQVDIEEKKLYNIKDLKNIRLIKWRGFYNIDLLKYCRNVIEEDTEYLNAYYKRIE